MLYNSETRSCGPEAWGFILWARIIFQDWTSTFGKNLGAETMKERKGKEIYNVCKEVVDREMHKEEVAGRGSCE